MSTKYTYLIEFSGEPAAGLHAYSEKVTIELHSGKPFGEPGEFEGHMRDALSEWFDGAGVELVTPELIARIQRRTEQENQSP